MRGPRIISWIVAICVATTAPAATAAATGSDREPVRQADAPQLVMIGDSVMLGAQRTAEQRFSSSWNLVFDAAVSRRTSTGADVLASRAHQIGNHVVISLGYNDGWAREPFRTRVLSVLEHLDAVEHVFWLSMADPPGGIDYTAANGVLRELAAERANLTVLEWHDIAANDPATTWDGLHLTSHGATAMVDLIEQALGDPVPTQPVPAQPKAVCSTASNPAPTPDPATAAGYWLLDDQGIVHPFGAAPHLGDLVTRGVTTAPASMRATADGDGYWIVDRDGVVHPFGTAAFHGDMSDTSLNGPVRRIEPHPARTGYWLVASDGGVFTFGDARFFGSTGDRVLNEPVISMSATTSGQGYWLVAGDGGVFTFGDAPYRGSTGDIALNEPIIDMTVHPAGNGYWLYAADGGVFTFGTAGYHGSVPGMGLCSTPNTVAMRATPDGGGYWVVTDAGWVIALGNAIDHGGDPFLAPDAQVIDIAIAAHGT